MLCPLHIIVCCRKKLADYTFDIITDISCLCEGSSVSDCKRHIQKSGKGLDQIGLTTASRSNHKHVGFFNLNAVFFL